MSGDSEAGNAEIGRWIGQARERAGIKQVELARRITWSQAVLSRVESGERELAPDELDLVLDAIGTAEAAALKAAFSHDWQVLPRPPLDHPEYDALWEAELVARALKARQEDPLVRSVFQRRLVALSAEVHEAARRVMSRDYQVAFIGGIGIGKSTAICRVTKLEVPDLERDLPTPVLEAGAGGITLCEVHVRSGPGVGILVEPQSEDEIRADVYDFAEYLREGSQGNGSSPDSSEGTQQGVSREVERAIRNMAGLRIRRNRKDADGNRLPSLDEARELAQSVGSTRELVVEILSRMALHSRDRRDIWHDISTGKGALLWLKETFEAINNGRHPDFTMPRRIEVVVPEPILAATNSTLRLVDTKGIDGGVIRADLEGHLDDTHTVAVLCSRFNDAPAEAAQRLLERARDSGVRGLEHRALLLVLPHTGESLEMKDESGLRVESAGEGCDLKMEQIQLRLRSQQLPNVSIGFFNAREDSPELLRSLILDRITAAQDRRREQLQAVTKGASAVLENHHQEEVQEVQRMAGRMLRTSLSQMRTIAPTGDHVHQDLLEALGKAHWSTVRAAVRREGEWPNLSYTHHLGYGARRLAMLACSGKVTGFAQTCETMSSTADFVEASDLIGQAERTLQSAFDDLLRKVQLMGQTSYGEELRKDIAFWVECGSESGKGYKARIVTRNQSWFGAEQRGTLEAELWRLIQREWEAVLDQVEALLEPDV